MKWTEVVELIVKLVWTYGPQVYALAKKVYEVIEAWSEKRKEQVGEIPTPALKAMKFNRVMADEMQAKGMPELTDKGMDGLREGVWAVKNRQKADYTVVRRAMGK